MVDSKSSRTQNLTVDGFEKSGIPSFLLFHIFHRDLTNFQLFGAVLNCFVRLDLFEFLPKHGILRRALGNAAGSFRVVSTFTAIE